MKCHLCGSTENVERVKVSINSKRVAEDNLCFGCRTEKRMQGFFVIRSDRAGYSDDAKGRVL